MGKRCYFYTDKNGKMQKYIYCNMCPDGGKPFTADQEYNPTTKEGLFITTGKHITFCISCAKNLGVLKSEEEPIRSFYIGPPSKKRKK